MVSMSMELVMRSSFRECVLAPPLYTAGGSFSAYVCMHVGRWCTNVVVVQQHVVVVQCGGGGRWWWGGGGGGGGGEVIMVIKLWT